MSPVPPERSAPPRLTQADPHGSAPTDWERWNGRAADVELQAPAIAEMAVAARQTLCGIADATGLLSGELRDITVAVGEAYSNAATHAYDGSGDRPLWLRVWVDPAVVRVVVGDHGRGMSLNGSADREGIGLPLMRALASRFEIVSDAAGSTVIDMSFARGSAE